MREAFALQKLLTFFQQKNIGIFEILMFEILTTSLVLNNRALEFKTVDAHEEGIYWSVRIRKPVRDFDIVRPDNVRR